MFSRRPKTPVRRLIVGLGNPGPEYANTRHNVGFAVVERLATQHRIPIKTSLHGARVGQGTIAGEQVALVKPLTFMNLSGRSVGPLLERYSLTAAELIVIYDDVDLPLGKLRLRPGGSAGGHNGMKSIIGAIGTSDFPRIRIGIGRGGRDDLIDHVLTKFKPAEREAITLAIERAADAVVLMVQEGVEIAMNRFNTGE